MMSLGLSCHFFLVVLVLFGCSSLGLGSVLKGEAPSCAFGGEMNGWCSGWSKQGRSAADEEHSVIFAVKLKDGAAASCSSMLMKISDPNSAFYGKHLSIDQVGDLTTSKENTRIVREWLHSQGFSEDQLSVSYNGEFIRVTGTVSKLEDVLEAEFHLFKNEDGKTIKITQSYSLPEEISHLVDFVSNTVRFPPSIKPLIHTPSQTGAVDPNVLIKYYNVTNAIVSNGANQSLFEALGQSFSPSDLQLFQQQFSVAQHAINHVKGPNTPSSCKVNPNACIEANLDVQYILAIAQKADTTYWSIGSSQDIFTDWIVALSSDPSPPLVHSISYGSLANEDPRNDMQRFNTEACKLGLRGLTIVVASGDDGVANFLARNDPSQCGFDPSFPASSPYVTAVGATQGPESNQPEIVCSSATGGGITSGGGFSLVFDRPSYQDKAVSSYLKNGPNLPPLNMFRSKGRAYPDVALMGHNYEIVIGGQTYEGSGTSASTPVFAGMITLINDERMKNGKSPLGFLNPALYLLGGSNKGIFHDITVGENNCCASSVCCQYGFNATVGWDPVTGWGSVNFPNLKKALAAL